MKTKSTPGPWRVDRYSAYIHGPHGTILRVSGTGCCGDPEFDATDADLALVESSPELLDQLKVARHLIWRLADQNTRDAYLPTMDALISKATGVS